jgi:hypothetical protein
MPRALFLTRIYLWGTDVQVDPYWAEPIPAAWWKIGHFWLEGLKFWGSLIRVVFAAFGWETQKHFLEIGRPGNLGLRRVLGHIEFALENYGKFVQNFFSKNSFWTPTSISGHLV